MALKDLLVYVDQTQDSHNRLRLAADLAVRHDSHLTALFVKEWSHGQQDWRKSAELGLVSAAGVQDLEQRIEASINAIVERFKSTLTSLERDRGLRAEMRVIDGVAAIALPQYARYADLCVLGRDEPQELAAINYTFSEQLLFVTGRPVLFVPPHGPAGTLGRHILVAWNSSRPARSLNDALPLIEGAERTTIVMINPSDTMHRREGPPGEHVIEHLRRHGINGEVLRIENVPHASIAERLQSEAHTLSADLLVAGAFGHPRLWEKMLGGVTRDFLLYMRFPIFMSY